MAELTAEVLRDLLTYDSILGVFRWKKNRQGHAKAGDEAGSLNPHRGYHAIKIGQRRYPRGRLAFLYVYGRWPEGEIDHKNGIRNDDRIINLREATRSQQNQNIRVHADSHTGVKGATFNHKTRAYEARIHVNGKTRYLGQFPTAAAAGAAYATAAKEIFGEFAAVNR